MIRSNCSGVCSRACAEMVAKSDPDRFREFAVRYRRELRNEHASEVLDALARRARRRKVTLVYAARDQEHNGALVLARELERRLKVAGPG